MNEFDQELTRVNQLRTQKRQSGLNTWDYAVMVLRTALALARQTNDMSAASELAIGVCAELTPDAATVFRQALNGRKGPVFEALQELSITPLGASARSDPALLNDVARLMADLEVRRSVLHTLHSGARVHVLVVSHVLPFIPEIYTGLCLLNRVLLDDATSAFPGELTIVSESLEERVALHFGQDIDHPTWIERLRTRWEEHLNDIFSARGNEQFGPLSNVVILTSTGSKRAPVDYVPRPLIDQFGRDLMGAISDLRKGYEVHDTRAEDRYRQTREWLEKNLQVGGYGNPRRSKVKPDTLIDHPSMRLADKVQLGIPSVSTQSNEPTGRICTYCGGPAQSIVAPEVAEGSGVRKFRKAWITDTNRPFVNLCARCSLASFLQLRLLGCYSAGLDCGPKRYFTVFHNGIYPDSRLDFLQRWAVAYYRLLREGDLIRQLSNPLAGTQTGQAENDSLEDPVGTNDQQVDVKRNLRAIRRTLEEIQSRAEELRAYLRLLQTHLPDIDTDVGLSPDDLIALGNQLADAEALNPAALDTEAGNRVVELWEALRQPERLMANQIAGPIQRAFRSSGRADTGIGVYDLGGPATSRLVLLALPVLPKANSGKVDLHRHFSMSRAAVCLTLGWLWHKYPGTYWWGRPIEHPDGLIHTPFETIGERRIRQFEAAWTLAQEIVPARLAEYPQLLSWAEQLIDDPVGASARILRRQGDERSPLRRLKTSHLADFVSEVTSVGRN